MEAARHTLVLPTQVADIYRAVSELENKYPGRKFTPDGHLVGSIGEVIAAERFDLELLPASAQHHDAINAQGRLVQIKLTGGTGISLNGQCDLLLAMKILDEQYAECVYYGEGLPVWNACGALQKNGQCRISLSRLRKLRDDVPQILNFGLPKR